MQPQYSIQKTSQLQLKALINTLTINNQDGIAAEVGAEAVRLSVVNAHDSHQCDPGSIPGPKKVRRFVDTMSDMRFFRQLQFLTTVRPKRNGSSCVNEKYF